MSARRGTAVLGLAVMLGVIGLSGCCSLGIKNCSTTDMLTLVGDQDLNKCNTTTSTPVSVRVYYLTQKAKFLSADFDDLWDDPKGTLQADFVGDAKDLKVIPGQSVVFKEIRPAEADFVGIIADFCETDGTRRKIIELNDKALAKDVKLYQLRLTVD